MANIIDNVIIRQTLARFRAGDMDSNDALEALMAQGVSREEAIRQLRNNPNPYAAPGYDPFPQEPSPQTGPTVEDFLAALPSADSFVSGPALSDWAKKQQANKLFGTNENFKSAVNQRIREAGLFLNQQGQGNKPPVGNTPPPVVTGAPAPSDGGLFGRAGGLLGKAADAAQGLDLAETPATQFNQFLAAQPFGPLYGVVDRLAQSREGPLSAIHTLQEANQGKSAAVGSFKDFLAQLPPETFFGGAGVTITDLLNSIRDKMANSAAPFDMSIIEGLGGQAPNIISQYARENVGDLFAPFAEQTFRRRLAAFQGKNPNVNPFLAFLQNNFDFPGV